MADSKSRKRNSRDHPGAASGAGGPDWKSSSGNTILGQDVFSSSVSASSVTRQCSKSSGSVGGRQVSLVDTPGLFHTSLNEDEVAREVSKCVNMSCPGPHAILLVLRVGRFTPEEQGAVESVEKIFGPGAWKYTMVLFTHSDSSSLQQALKDVGPELQKVLERVEGRYYELDNKRADERCQVLQLLVEVEKMVQKNGGEYYSNPTYVKVSRLLAEREQELKERYSQELEQKLSAVEQKCKEELTKARNDANEHKHLLEEKEKEMDELRRYFEVVREKCRRVVEEMSETDTLDNVHYHRTLSYCPEDNS